MAQSGFKMDICHLRSKLFCMIVLLFMITGIAGCLKQENITDGNNFMPMICVDGNLYVVSANMKNTDSIDDDFIFYGYIKGSVENKNTVPHEDLQTTEILSDQKGYKVYLSSNKEIISIYLEDTSEYTYYELYLKE